MSFFQLYSAEISRDLIAFLFTLIAIQGCVKINGFLVDRKVINNKLGRKLVHIFVIILFISCWTLFSDSLLARFLSALVPFIFAWIFFFAGIGWKKASKDIISFTRYNDSRELLFGPFYYAIVLTIVTLIFWRNSPIGILALILLSVGDGLADIVGRRWGVNPFPFNKSKSWEGFTAMFVGSFILGLFFVIIFSLCGYYEISFIHIIPKIFVIALFTTFVESITSGDFDNLTVSLSSVLLGLLFQL